MIKDSSSRNRNSNSKWHYEVAIVKSYGLLKEELEGRDAEKISGKLFPEDTKLREDIRSAEQKRRVVDFLLKKVKI